MNAKEVNADQAESLLKQGAGRNKIGLLGPFSFGNLGNAALQQVLVDNLRKHVPEAEFYGCCIDPDDSTGERLIRAFPLNRTVRWPEGLEAFSTTPECQPDSQSKASEARSRLPSGSILPEPINAAWSKAREVREELAFCRKAHRLLKDFRLLVFGLGGLFDEVWGGKWGDLYSYFRWAILARLAGVPFVCLSVGVEEVSTRLGKLFCKTTLTLAGFCSFRDVESKEKAGAMGVTGESRVFPDLAFGLEVGDFMAQEAEPTGRETIAVSPMPYCDPRFWPVKEPSVYQVYLAKLSSFVSWLLRNGYAVVLFPTQVRMDRSAIEELKAAVLRDAPTSSYANLTAATLRSVGDCLALLSRVDMVVTSRLHGVILAHLVGTPVVALSPASKIDRLMEGMDLNDYVLSIREFDVQTLIDRFKKLKANRESVRSAIRHSVGQYRRDVTAQFELLFRTGQLKGPVQ